MNLSPDKLIRKITAQVDFIHCHPWRSPYGPDKAVQICSIQNLWEGRFKSQPLLAEAALPACMAYVDLNPIRANITKTPETSAHTSIMLRTKYAKQGEQPSVLAPFIGNPKKGMSTGLPFPIEDYFELVDLTGRCIRHDKPGFIDNANNNILTRLNISPENWLKLTTKFESHFKNVVGSPASIKKYRQNQKLKRLQDICSSEALFNTG